MKTVTHRGITATQCSNNHIVFTKDNRRVAHFAQKEPKTAEELKQMIDFYYNVLLEEIQNDSERAEK